VGAASGAGAACRGAVKSAVAGRCAAPYVTTLRSYVKPLPRLPYGSLLLLFRLRDTMRRRYNALPTLLVITPAVGYLLGRLGFVGHQVGPCVQALLPSTPPPPLPPPAPRAHSEILASVMPVHLRYDVIRYP
jgi:hypothetical protein